MKKVISVPIAVSIFAMAWLQSAAAATLLVPGQYASIQAAIDAAQPGDTIELAAGIYTESPILISGKSGLTMRGQGRVTTILRPSNTTAFTFQANANAQAGMVIRESQNLIFESFQVDCINLAGQNFVWGLGLNQVDDITFNGCLFQNMSVATDANFNNGPFDYIMSIDNQGGSFNPDNHGSVTFANSEFYNTGRMGLRVANFIDLHVTNTIFRKSRGIPAAGYGIFLYAQVSALIEDSTFSYFRFPFENDGAVEFSSSAIAIGAFYDPPGMSNWYAQNGLTTNNIVIRNTRVHESYVGVFAGSSFGWFANFAAGGVIEVDMIDSDIYDNFTTGVMADDNNAELYPGSGIRMRVHDSRLFGNDTGVGNNAARPFGQGFRTITSIEVNNSELFDNIYGLAAVNSISNAPDSQLSVHVTNSLIAGPVTVAAVWTNGIYNVSANFWDEANPDVVAKVIAPFGGLFVPILDSIFTNEERTQPRGALTVGPANSAYATFADAVADATGNDVIAVFDANASVDAAVTIASDRTVWTKAGLAILPGGSITISEGITLTLDGVAITGGPGGMTIDDATAALLINRVPVFGADGASFFAQGRVAWAAGDVELIAVFGTNGDQGTTAISDWDTRVSLGTQGVGKFRQLVEGLAAGTYTLRIAAILQSDTNRVAFSSARTFELVRETGTTDITSTNTTVNINVEVGAGQQVTIRVFEENKSGGPSQTTSTNSSGSVSLDDLFENDGIWFVEVERDTDGESNTSEFGIQRRTYQPDTWNLISLIWNLSDFTMGGALGQALGNGLYDPGIMGEKDAMYVPSASGEWQQFEWNGTSWDAINGSLTNVVDPLSSFWLKTSAEGGNRVAIYIAEARTGTQSVTVNPGWSTLTWPVPQTRTEAQGWGFPRRNGANAWTDSDLLVLTSSGTFSTFLQLRPDGRWHRVGESTPASDVVLRPGTSFIYFNSSANPFTWTPGE